MLSKRNEVPKGLSCGSKTCNGLDEYCDPYETICKSCEEICVVDLGKFDVCAQRCSNFLRDVVFSRLDEVRTLRTFMLVTIALTSAALIAIFALVAMKIGGRRRRRRKAEKYPLPHNDFNMIQVRNAYNPNQVTPVKYGNSVQTASTRLEDGRSSGRSNRDLTGRPRIPSEDRAPTQNGGVYDNRAMSTPSPPSKTHPPPVASPGSRLPPIRASPHASNRPYTISHSQVV